MDLGSSNEQQINTAVSKSKLENLVGSCLQASRWAHFGLDFSVTYDLDKAFLELGL